MPGSPRIEKRMTLDDGFAVVRDLIDGWLSRSR